VRVTRVHDLGKASVQHAAHHRGRVCGPQFKPGAKLGLIIAGSIARQLGAQVPAGSLILACGWTRPAIWTTRVGCCARISVIRSASAKEITGARVEIGPAVRGIDVGTRPAG
jgi:hypothetical protein